MQQQLEATTKRAAEEIPPILVLPPREEFVIIYIEANFKSDHKVTIWAQDKERAKEIFHDGARFLPHKPDWHNIEQLKVLTPAEYKTLKLFIVVFPNCTRDLFCLINAANVKNAAEDFKQRHPGKEIIRVTNSETLKKHQKRLEEKNIPPQEIKLGRITFTPYIKGLN